MRKGAQVLARGKIGFKSEVIQVYTKNTKNSTNKISQLIKEVGNLLDIGQCFKKPIIFQHTSRKYLENKKIYILFYHSIQQRKNINKFNK